MSKEAYYFSHDSNARNDDKILELRAEFGWEGYGLYWAIIETLRDGTNYSYPSNARAGLALSLNIDKARLEQLLNTCFSLGLLVEDDGVIYSESLMKRMEKINEKSRRRAEAGRLGGIAKAEAKQSSSNAKANPSKESKVKERKVKEIKEEFAPSVLLLPVEYSTLIAKHGKEKTEWMLTKLSNHKMASGKSYKSDYGAINSWVVDAADQSYKPTQAKGMPDNAVKSGEYAGMVF